MVGMGGISMEEQWHNLSIEDCLVAQESTESGISVDEVLARRERYGLNKLGSLRKHRQF